MSLISVALPMIVRVFMPAAAVSVYWETPHSVLLIEPDFEEQGSPVWSYMSQISMVNLHILFKAIDVSQQERRLFAPVLTSIQEGITKGQLDFTDRLDKLVLTFFPWKEPNFKPEDVLIWMTSLVGVVSVVAPIMAASRLRTSASQGQATVFGGSIAALAGSGLNQVSKEIKPE
jgi:hypothetical protein